MNILFKKNFINTFLISFSSFLQIVALAVLSRRLGDSSYGEFVQFISLVMIISGVSHFGMPNAILRWGAIYRQNNQNDSTKYLLMFSFISSSILTGLVLVLLSILDSYFYNIPYLKFFIIVPLWVNNELLASFARANEDTAKYFIIKNIIPIITQIFGYIYIDDITLISVLNIFILSYVISISYGITVLISKINDKQILGKKINLKEPSPIVSYFKFGIAGTFIGFLWAAKGRVIVLLTGYYIGPIEAGYVYNASRFSFVFTLLLSGINILLGPQVARLHHQGRISELQKIYENYIKWVVIITFPILVFIGFESKLIMGILFGQGKDLAGEILFYSSFFCFLSLLAGSPGLILQMSGFPKYEVYTTALSVILGSFTVLFAQEFYGVVGGVIAIGFTAVIIDQYRSWFVFKKVGILAVHYKDLVIISIFLLSILFLKGIITSIYFSIITSFIVSIGLVYMLLDRTEIKNILPIKDVRDKR